MADMDHLLAIKEDIGQLKSGMESLLRELTEFRRVMDARLNHIEQVEIINLRKDVEHLKRQRAMLYGIAFGAAPIVTLVLRTLGL